MRPCIGDVPELLATVRVQQAVNVESLVIDVVRHSPVEAGQAVADWYRRDVARRIAQRDRHTPIGSVPPRTGAERKIRRPQVTRNSFGQLIALTNPDDEALIVRSERAVGPAAVGVERSGELTAATDEILSVNRADLFTRAELEDVEGVRRTRVESGCCEYDRK